MTREKVEIAKIYNLFDPDGHKLQLYFGRKVDNSGAAIINGKDKGWRWSFYGTNIPMPVRKGEWFNGFPEETMLSWLEGNGGWVVHTVVNAVTGEVEVRDLPDAPDASYENAVLAKAICALYNGNNIDDCATLYGLTTGVPYTMDFLRSKVHAILANNAKVKAEEPEEIKVNVNVKYFVDDGEDECGSIKAYDNYDRAKENYNAFMIAGWPKARMYKVVDCNADTTEPATETDWIPVSSGRYPVDGRDVQVTYLSCVDGATPYCNGMAHRDGNRWFWAICEDPVLPVITAWRPVGTPYMADATTKATVPEINEDEFLYFVDDGRCDYSSIEKCDTFEQASSEHARNLRARLNDSTIYKAFRINPEQ